MSKDGAYFQDSPGSPWKVVPRRADGKDLDPLVAGSVSEQISALEAEQREHQLAVSKGDERFGFLNAKNRTERLQEIQNKLTGLRTSLGAGGGPAAKKPAAPAATPAGTDPFAKLKW